MKATDGVSIYKVYQNKKEYNGKLDDLKEETSQAMFMIMAGTNIIQSRDNIVSVLIRKVSIDTD